MSVLKFLMSRSGYLSVFVHVFCACGRATPGKKEMFFSHSLLDLKSLSYQLGSRLVVFYFFLVKQVEFYLEHEGDVPCKDIYTLLLFCQCC